MQPMRKLFTLATVFCAGSLFVMLFAIPGRVPKPKGDKGRRFHPGYTQDRGSPQPPALFFPPRQDDLMKANFSDDRKEDSSLETLRKYGLVSGLPDAEAIKVLDVPNITLIIHSYLDNADILCQRKLRMGKIGDGGWEVCDDYQWRPVPPCLVYSFGIKYDFSFDDDIGRVYGCDVYSFDPSMYNQPTYQRSARVAFYRYGLGGQSGNPVKTDKGWILHSLSNLKYLLNHTDRVIDVLKMDVEGWEWQSLLTMIQEHQLHNVRQLLLEFHLLKGESHLRAHLQLLASLERIGFRKFCVHKNGRLHEQAVRTFKPFPVKRVTLYEVHYVNVQFQL